MVASLWSITRDDEFHADADEFNPDRYEEGKERVPWYVFGYGHRYIFPFPSHHTYLG
jgi:cytochrome P450